MKSVLLKYAKEANIVDYFDNVKYDREKNMSVYQEGGNNIPLIDSPSVNLGIQTKTEVARETDDVFPMILALETKTMANRESDDQGFVNN